MSNIMKATRELIKARQPFARDELEIVSVTKRCGGKLNDCFKNACSEIGGNCRAKIVSGWIVAPFDKTRNTTEIVQHWWNIDMNGKHFDTTPFTNSNFQYVSDTDISVYGQESYGEIDSCVASSLLLKDGKFLLVNKINGCLQYKKTQDLSNESLFAHSMYKLAA